MYNNTIPRVGPSHGSFTLKVPPPNPSRISIRVVRPHMLTYAKPYTKDQSPAAAAAAAPAPTPHNHLLLEI